jgi:hypothetical protein
MYSGVESTWNTLLSTNSEEIIVVGGQEFVASASIHTWK